ncbi:hypothetical protein [Nocardia jinanensis]|uniref:Uncharacterized protein n=1 Tax=Nocardia jinanensis TaxID=382504 RepID=A0A917RDU5_9NOCA|nr:hypothetical protein [Nocardia jinanensis]GGL02018.1 hypothetical protein GCM10011588_15950 [Nocardia jinanensis]
MSTVATTHKDHRQAGVLTPRFERPGPARSLLIVWVILMAAVSLALALL